DFLPWAKTMRLAVRIVIYLSRFGVCVLEGTISETSLNSVTIPCNYSSERCGRFAPKILWLRFLAHTHEVLCDPTCTNTTKFKVHPKTSKHENLLEINHLSVGDSAIYVCGIASTHSKAITSKQTGNGTVLVVRGQSSFLPFQNSSTDGLTLFPCSHQPQTLTETSLMEISNSMFHPIKISRTHLEEDMHKIMSLVRPTCYLFILYLRFL
uniref:Ig-like domain-containing protein n=1 Tax=Varanus komodoensis TaxID=61221 RepID=A0A8D2J9I9_VARKO